MLPDSFHYSSKHPHVFLDLGLALCQRCGGRQQIDLTHQFIHEGAVLRQRNPVFLYEPSYILFCLHNVSRYSLRCLRPRERCDLTVPEGIPVIISISFIDFSSM